MLMQLKLSLRIFTKQITNLFIVQLKIRTAHKKLLIFTRLNILKYCIKCSRHYTAMSLRFCIPFHGVCLTCPCLAICKYSSVVSFKNILNNRPCCLIKYSLLTRTKLIKHMQKNSLAFTYSKL